MKTSSSTLSSLLAKTLIRQIEFTYAKICYREFSLLPQKWKPSEKSKLLADLIDLFSELYSIDPYAHRSVALYATMPLPFFKDPDKALDMFMNHSIHNH